MSVAATTPTTPTPHLGTPIPVRPTSWADVEKLASRPPKQVREYLEAANKILGAAGRGRILLLAQSSDFSLSKVNPEKNCLAPFGPKIPIKWWLGGGRSPEMSCGQWKFTMNEANGQAGNVLYCPDHPEAARPFFSSCNSLLCDCPDCRNKKREEAAARAFERLEGGGDALEEFGERVHLRHFIFSPPPRLQDALWSKKGALEFKRWTTQIIRAAGIRGGTIVFHPFRLTEGFKSWWRRADRPGGSMWKYVIEEGLHIAPEPGETRVYGGPVIRWSPHFHVIGYGWLIPSDEFYDLSDGWVYKAVGGERFGEDLKHTIRYIVSHAGVAASVAPKPRGKHDPAEGLKAWRASQTVSYFGTYSTRYLRKIKAEEKEIETYTCPECEGPMHLGDMDFHQDGSPDYDAIEDKGIYEVSIRPVSYVVVIPPQPEELTGESGLGPPPPGSEAPGEGLDSPNICERVIAGERPDLDNLPRGILEDLYILYWYTDILNMELPRDRDWTWKLVERLADLGADIQYLRHDRVWESMIEEIPRRWNAEALEFVDDLHRVRAPWFPAWLEERRKLPGVMAETLEGRVRETLNRSGIMEWAWMVYGVPVGEIMAYLKLYDTDRYRDEALRLALNAVLEADPRFTDIDGIWYLMEA